MKVLHTADWHLGQRLYGLDRTEEHQCFLDWLLTAIKQHAVEALVVAGDIFDSGAPPASAQQQYYRFLVELSQQGICRDVVVVGGNHDSPAFLNAAAPVLHTLRVHVLGGASARDEDHCVPLPSETDPRLLVVAVPFLRDADVRRAVPGETPDERQERLRAGIHHHYARLAACAAPWRARGLPVMATGHLFAAGAAESPSERPLTIGTLGQVTAAAFPPEAFDYVALGHLHRAQCVGSSTHIRYSGAPVPLSFAEANHPQQVLLLTFGTESGCPIIEALAVPCRRRLVRFSGTLSAVLTALAAFTRTADEHPAWAEIRFESAETNVYCLDQLRTAARAVADHVLVLGTPRHDRPGAPTDDATTADETVLAPHLDDLTPGQVFGRLLDQRQYAPDTEVRTRLETTFAELLARRAAGAGQE